MIRSFTQLLLRYTQLDDPVTPSKDLESEPIVGFTVHKPIRGFHQSPLERKKLVHVSKHSCILRDQAMSSWCFVGCRGFKMCPFPRYVETRHWTFLRSQDLYKYVWHNGEMRPGVARWWPDCLGVLGVPVWYQFRNCIDRSLHHPATSDKQRSVCNMSFCFFFSEIFTLYRDITQE